jgi:transcriptional regulator with GAF, ATPase, and Fis domain
VIVPDANDGLPPEPPVLRGAAPLESILCTDELRRRPWRSPDYRKENGALVALAAALADSPHTILQTLAEKILEVTESDSAGLSLLTTEDGGKSFYWPAIAGIWKPHLGGGTPRNFGPCGDVLDRGTTLLFRNFERRYTYLEPVMPPAEECLLIPFYVRGHAVGTMWAIMHSRRRQFDAEDERLVRALGTFASAAYQTVASLRELEFQVAERGKAATALRDLTDALETRIRARTEELEERNEEVQKLRDRLQSENIRLREEIDETSMFEEIVGSSPPLRRVLVQVEKVAPTDSTVLVTGETGTGKELIARAVHKRSGRSGRAFVAVNCAAIPPALVASELFGHEKGAFTGATQRHVGRFELADGGTIFLDEVSDLPPETQVALLRVIQEGEFEPVGRSRPISVDVRILAATNRDLAACVAGGAFRQDLFYRLNVFPISMPPLRERAQDIPMLVEYFIERYARKTGKKIAKIEKRSLNLLKAYRWPGNIRELQNVIERAVILFESGPLRLDESWLGGPGERPGLGALKAAFVDAEKETIEAALSAANGRVSGPNGAAARLGLPRQTLEWRIVRLGINKHRFRR